MANEARRNITVIGVLLIGVVLGVFGAFLLDGEDNEESVTPSTSAPQVQGPGPYDELDGVPVGYARTEEGAVAAAANFNLLSGRDDLLDLDALKRAMQTLAAPSWKSDAAKQAKNGYEYVTETYGADADLSAAVLRYDVVDFTSDHAVVSLWTVNVLSGSNRPNVDEVWGIVTIDLEWVDGDWRVGGIESSPGPAPLDLPSGQPDQPARALMEDFDEFEGAPVP